MKYERKENLLHIQTQGSYHNKPVSAFLDDYHISKATRYQYLQEKRILLNDTVVKNPAECIHKEDVLTLVLPQTQIDWPLSQKDCSIVYENEFVMIVHKDVDCIIHGEPDDTDCLNARVAKVLADRHTPMSIRPIHRLDKDTCGLILYVKIPFFQPYFDDALEKRKISRHYYAVTTGKPPVNTDPFLINDRIGRDRHHSNRFRVSSSGKTASTTVQLIQSKNGYHVFGCTLDTGRTHQIRVHLSAHRWPIVNDVLYGTPSKDFNHMGLWANEITFHDPITHKRHTIKDFDNPDFRYFND